MHFIQILQPFGYQSSDQLHIQLALSLDIVLCSRLQERGALTVIDIFQNTGMYMLSLTSSSEASEHGIYLKFVVIFT